MAEMQMRIPVWLRVDGFAEQIVGWIEVTPTTFRTQTNIEQASGMLANVLEEVAFDLRKTGKHAASAEDMRSDGGRRKLPRRGPTREEPLHRA